MSTTSTTQNPTSNLSEQIENRDLFLLTREEMELLLPWIRETLTNQPKHEDNAHLCQVASKILRTAHQLYGTEPGTRETCICEG